MSNILLVDDDDMFCDAVGQMLESIGHHVTIASSLETALSYISSERYDNILLDFMLPDGSGLHLIDALKDHEQKPKITLISGHPSVTSIMSGLCGPHVNYLIKPVRLAQIKQALASHDDGLDKESELTRHFGCLVGESAPMTELYTMIERVAKTKANVMLMGESGVGKELVAQAIHNASHSEGPLVAANCGAFSRELIGSELFGHEKGAFTGAIGKKIGVFEQATSGSLFLDEVTEMPIDIQPNLLRVLETGRVTRVGGVKDFAVDCRVISATNRSTEQLAEENVLREDLYFRLAVFPIKIPALRERIGDIPLLANYFLQQLNRENGTQLCLDDEQMQRLEKYDWPGNVRELRHAIHRAFIMSDPSQDNIMLPEDLASPFAKQNDKAANPLSAGQTIDDVERALIEVTLKQLDGDKPKAADMLGISLKTLYNRLNKYGEAIEM